MFEMFITLAAALIAAIYGLSKSVFMNGPYRNYYRIGLLIFILVIYIIYVIYHKRKHSRITKLNVNLEDYLYYEKFTSPLYRIGYFISYLIQNILFDYIYMRRNFNFCKGLDVYDGGVSEYYIKFRNTWYRYLKLTIMRHRVSLKKLQAFSSDMKNEMIVEALSQEEDKSKYLQFASEVHTYFEEHNIVTKTSIKSFSNYAEIPVLYRKNLLKKYKALVYVEKREPKITELVNRQSFRSDKDINDFKKMKFR